MATKTTVGRSKAKRTRAKGLEFGRAFGNPEMSPYDEVRWETRTAEIKDGKGNVIFKQEGVEVPASWSETATNIVASKYFHGMQGTPRRESSARQLVSRVADVIAAWGEGDGFFATPGDADAFGEDLAWLLLNQHGSFNSPVWFNVGLWDKYGVEGTGANWRWDDATGEAVPVPPGQAYKYPQASACFIVSVDDNMESIADRAKAEMMLFKYGSGVGADNSTIRSSRERLSGGGRPSGPVSYMRVYDAIAGVTKSGGTVRRAAKMETLKDWHPDILEFVECKPKEEEKARALIAQGYDPDFNGVAYDSVRFQNANLSVRASDAFLEKVVGKDADPAWQTLAVTTGWPVGPDGARMPTYDAGLLMDKVAEGTWLCGDPGLQYEDTIQHWHTCPNTAPINSSNPCVEFMFIDDSACNLASLNLMKFRREDGTFDVERFRAACRVFIVAQEILVDRASYPTKLVAENSHRFRPLGLGYANLGALLMARGVAYGSDAGRDLAAAITATMHAQASLTSAEIARVKGPFDGFAANREPMLRVMGQHFEAVGEIGGVEGGEALEFASVAGDVFSRAIEAGEQHGYRNSQVTLLAPCGTIGFKMDCDTTGIEPAIGLVTYKKLAGGGQLKLVNRIVAEALESLEYAGGDISRILEHIEEHGTVEGSCIDPGHLPVFDCAFPVTPTGRSLHWRDHVLMMAAVQPFLSGAISKTVNMPADATARDIRDAYLEGWRLGLKALAIYRDGSKESQPVSTSKDGKANGKAESNGHAVAPPARRRLPATRKSLTHKFSVGGMEGYVTVGLYDDGSPGELFVQVAKEGSTVGGLVDAWATAVSLLFQHGYGVADLARKFSDSRFDPAGLTHNPALPVASSVIDYIARWLRLTFLDDPAGAVVVSTAQANGHRPLPLPVPAVVGHAPVCPNCGTLTVPTGRCHACPGCGLSLGCS